MSDVFDAITQIAVPFFAISSMLFVGLANSVRRLVRPLRDYRLVALVLFVNFVLVPLIAWITTQAFSLDQGFEVGLLVVSVAAGAPMLIKLTDIARGSVALAASLLVLLLILTIGYVPLVLPLLVPGDVEVDATPIAVSLTWTMLGPLAIGLALREWRQDWAERLAVYVQPVITPSLVVVVIATTLASGGRIIDILGEGAIASAFVLIAGSFVTGYALSPAKRETRGVLGLATAQRNMAAATVVAARDFADPNVLVMVVVTSVVATAVLFPAAFALGRRIEVANERERWRTASRKI